MKANRDYGLGLVDYFLLTANMMVVAMLCAKDDRSHAVAAVMNLICIIFAVYFWLVGKRRERDLELMR